MDKIKHWLLSWLFIQTILFGCIGWYATFQVFVNGAELSYIPPAQHARK